MEFQTVSSPHTDAAASTRRLMRRVLYALAPGLAAAVWFFGWGIAINVALAALFALAAEAAMLRLRGRPVRPALSDGSALVTAALLGLALPPLVPWWVVAVGIVFAIAVAKHLYGGLGYNVFNPAMAGYVVLLISFPREMTLWLTPAPLLSPEAPDLGASLAAVFLGQVPAGHAIDALTSATPLDLVRTRLGLDESLAQIRQADAFGLFAGRGWEWINAAFLAGGLWLAWRRALDWRIPASLLAALGGLALVFFLIDPAHYPSPLFHLFSGAAMLGAFFIATDPITAATTPRGRWLYGAAVGALIYVIRTWGGYPDGVAFAVLLLNMGVPLIDAYTQPRVFGGGGNR